MNDKWVVYVLLSEVKKTRYVGFTSNLDRRLKEHNSGFNKSTKAYKPWKLVYKEIFELKLDARKRELYLKSGIGREFLNDLLDL
ncbi:GIY-YIG nuclease family protein [Pedobacter cryophilus]|uniref:GIY-YIG nuclease family protein n=1 Tax=Pedobacter cryophilus TaxID=2571271 RepID=A0A4U1C0P0_9SPHI|nr:GIY-YIG nuclease family protein [Pedobacter cryophilus]TKB98605.1 GIY-YIG nuclease family protein [Pedobacter cryophilus]